MWSEPKFTGLRSLESSQAEEFYVPICHYHKVDLISTLLDSLIVQNAPRRSRRSSPPERAAGSHWKWMTSGHFDALAACGMNGQ